MGGGTHSEGNTPPDPTAGRWPPAPINSFAALRLLDWSERVERGPSRWRDPFSTDRAAHASRRVLRVAFDFPLAADPALAGARFQIVHESEPHLSWKTAGWLRRHRGRRRVGDTDLVLDASGPWSGLMGAGRVGEPWDGDPSGHLAHTVQALLADQFHRAARVQIRAVEAWRRRGETLDPPDSEAALMREWAAMAGAATLHDALVLPVHITSAAEATRVLDLFCAFVALRPAPPPLVPPDTGTCEPFLIPPRTPRPGRSLREILAGRWMLADWRGLAGTEDGRVIAEGLARLGLVERVADPRVGPAVLLGRVSPGRLGVRRECPDLVERPIEGAPAPRPRRRAIHRGLIVLGGAGLSSHERMDVLAQGEAAARALLGRGLVDAAVGGGVLSFLAHPCP